MVVFALHFTIIIIIATIIVGCLNCLFCTIKDIIIMSSIIISTALWPLKFNMEESDMVPPETKNHRSLLAALCI